MFVILSFGVEWYHARRRLRPGPSPGAKSKNNSRRSRLDTLPALQFVRAFLIIDSFLRAPERDD